MPQGQQDCPPGTIFREGHVRKFSKNSGHTVQRGQKVYTVKHKKNSAYIPATCVKPKQTRRNNAGLMRGRLVKYGYSFPLPDSKRKAALKRAMKEIEGGPRTVYGILRSAASLAKNSHPDAYLKFSKDMVYVQAYVPK